MREVPAFRVEIFEITMVEPTDPTFLRHFLPALAHPPLLDMFILSFNVPAGETIILVSR